jgi:sulfonate transport system ATP-binding protein
MNMTTSCPTLEVNIEGKRYGDGRPVLANVGFDVAAGEIVAVIGKSGSGKTTLLRILAGLDCDYTGSVFMNRSPVAGPSRQCGIVFQDSRLLPWFTVLQNVIFAVPDSIAGKGDVALAALEMVDMASAQALLPSQLSGGMEKRVALARAIAYPPRVLLLDEPFTAVDQISRGALQEAAYRIHSRNNLTTIIVTHDLDEAIYLSDRIFLIGGMPTTLLNEFRVSEPRPRERNSAAAISIKQALIGELV